MFPAKITREEMLAWTDEFRLTHPVVADTWNDLGQTFGKQSGRPQLIVLDREHTEVFNDTGSAATDKAHALIEQLLEED